jgi:hypothetical protein
MNRLRKMEAKKPTDIIPRKNTIVFTSSILMPP